MGQKELREVPPGIVRTSGEPSRLRRLSAPGKELGKQRLTQLEEKRLSLPSFRRAHATDARDASRGEAKLVEAEDPLGGSASWPKFRGALPREEGETWMCYDVLWMFLILENSIEK